MKITENKEVSALFYHPKKLLQIRIKGQVEFIQKEALALKKYLDTIQNSPSKQNYITLEAPSTKLKDKDIVLHGKVLHFLAIKIIPKKIEVLLLNREGH